MAGELVNIYNVCKSSKEWLCKRLTFESIKINSISEVGEQSLKKKYNIILLYRS